MDIFEGSIKFLNPRAAYWVGAQGGTVRRYYCRACGTLVDTDSAKWAPTKHAAVASERHEAECRRFLHVVDLACRELGIVASSPTYEAERACVMLEAARGEAADRRRLKLTLALVRKGQAVVAL